MTNPNWKKCMENEKLNVLCAPSLWLHASHKTITITLTVVFTVTITITLTVTLPVTITVTLTVISIGNVTWDAIIGNHLHPLLGLAAVTLPLRDIGGIIAATLTTTLTITLTVIITVTLTVIITVPAHREEKAVIA